MKVRIKRFDKEIPLPKRHTDGAAAFDLISRETIIIEPGKIGYAPVNIAVETPHDHFLLLAARSGTHKKGLMLANGIGIVDPDFSGDDDEIKIALYNFSDTAVTVERGDRIAQATFVHISKFDWDEVDTMPNKTRGGFGSTGSK